MLITHTGAAIDREDFRDEDELQALIFDHPELLGSDDSRELVSVKRELPTPAGRVDLLAVSPGGILTVVEVKLARNPQSRREVLAQIFDYVSALSDFSYFDLNKASGNELAKIIDGFDDSESLPNQIEEKLRNCLTRLVIAVDESSDDLRRLVEFMTNYTKISVSLVEIQKYNKDGEIVYSSNVIISPRDMQANKVGKQASDYPVLDKIVKQWQDAGDNPRAKISNRSWRQLRVDGWPSALHYEFITTHRDPRIFVRLDNELGANDPRCDKVSEAMDEFVGIKIKGRKLQARVRTRSGAGRIMFVALEPDESDKAVEFMKELVGLTKEKVGKALKP